MLKPRKSSLDTSRDIQRRRTFANDRFLQFLVVCAGSRNAQLSENFYPKIRIFHLTGASDSVIGAFCTHLHIGGCRGREGAQPIVFCRFRQFSCVKSGFFMLSAAMLMTPSSLS
jgi:hypothetical protein